MASPLPAGGNAVTDYVATRAGWHYVGVARGSGAYDITVEAYRPPLQGATPTQTLYLDFDGARVNTAIVRRPRQPGPEPVRGVPGQLGPDPRRRGRADRRGRRRGHREPARRTWSPAGSTSRFKLKILNSRDNADPWGKPNVSRIVVGGTIAESGVDTIGIAQSIDPGNFETEETALVLLDVLSAAGRRLGRRR